MIDPTKTAFIFPGQGSQFVGMGKALASQYPVASQTFIEADDVLGFALSKLCFEGPDEPLTQTDNVQPALYVAAIAALRTMYEIWGDQVMRPVCLAGHSLGELTALTAAGALNFPDGVKLVRKRGELMRDAGKNRPGGMAALLGLDAEPVRALCAEVSTATGKTVVVANDNCPGQVVIAGDEVALLAAMEQASRIGARRVMRLPVSIAPHTPLMAEAQQEFSVVLAATPFQPPAIPVISNIDAQPLQTTEQIRAELNAQLTSTVRWTECVQAIQKMGVTTYIEFGSKNVLIGLLKRIDKDATGIVVDSPEGVQSLATQ
jgi:[acyl-carrier-protein] S-malonyltransferase